MDGSVFRLCRRRRRRVDREGREGGIEEVLAQFMAAGEAGRYS